MVLLQAFPSLLSRSAGKVLGETSGWAVSALLGRTTPRERTALAAVVAAVAARQLLLLGVIAPKVATLLVASAPVAGSAPNGPIPIAWVALAGPSARAPCTGGVGCWRSTLSGRCP